MGCFWTAAVSIYHNWSKERTVVNQQQTHGRSDSLIFIIFTRKGSQAPQF